MAADRRTSNAQQARRRAQVDIGDSSLPAPAGLEVRRFEVQGEEYALFSFPVPEPQPPDDLTAAEQEVVRGVCRGQSNFQISKTRGVSPRTVANQLRSVYAKLGIGSRHELVARCLHRRNS